MASLLERLIRSFTHVPAAWLFLAAGLAISGVAWHITETQVERAARSKFDARIADARSTVQAHLHSHYDVLHALQGLFLVTPHVTREVFGRYVRNLKLDHRSGGVRAIGFSQYVPAAAKSEFVNRVRRDSSIDPRGFPDFDVKPPGDRAEYVVVTYVEPLEGNRTALGFDLTADPVRRASVEWARDSGSVSATGRLSLFTVPVEGEWGVSLRLAVYRHDLPAETTEQRRRAFRGVVSVNFLVRELVSHVLWQDASRPLQLRILDMVERTAGTSANGTTSDALLYDSGVKLEPGSSFGASVPLEVGRRIWNLQFTAPESYYLSAALSQ